MQRGCAEVNLIKDTRKRRPSSDEWHDHGRLAHQAVSFENKRGNSDWTRQCGYACLLDLRGVRAEPFGKRIFFMESPIDPTKRALQSSRVTLRRYLDSPFPTRGWGWNPFRQPAVWGQVAYVSGFWGLSTGSLPRAVGEDLGSVPSLKSAAALVAPAYQNHPFSLEVVCVPADIHRYGRGRFRGQCKEHQSEDADETAR